MTEALTVHFLGPFSWGVGDDVPSIYNTDAGRGSGVYLWTVSHEEGELVYYVGMTGRPFAQRMSEHFKEHSSGGYHLNSPEPLRRGVRKCLWPGRYDANTKTTVSEFISRLENLWPAIVDLAKLYRFFVAPMTCSRRVVERTEGAIARWLYAQPGKVGEFQEEGIRYPKRRPDETPMQVSLECPSRLLGLPPVLEI